MLAHALMPRSILWTRWGHKSISHSWIQLRILGSLWWYRSNLGSNRGTQSLDRLSWVWRKWPRSYVTFSQKSSLFQWEFLSGTAIAFRCSVRSNARTWWCTLLASRHGASRIYARDGWLLRACYIFSWLTRHLCWSFARGTASCTLARYWRN